MNQELKIGTVWQSNTVYTAKTDRLDITLADTVFCDNAEAVGSSIAAGDSVQVAFYLENIENTVLDFAGAKLVLHGRIVPFVLLHCKNVTVKNLQIDYDRPFYTQADVLDVRLDRAGHSCYMDSLPGELRLRICDGFPYRVEDHGLIAVSDSWEKRLNRFDCLLWMYDRTERKSYPIILGLFGDEIFSRDNPPLPIRHLKVYEEGDALVVRGDFPAQWETNGGNNALLITHEVRDKNTFIVIGCEDFTLQSCLLICGAAMGLCGMHCRNLTVDGFDILRNVDGNGRLVANNADGIHLFNCAGKVMIRNCHMEGLLDDTVNIHNNYYTVKQVADDRHLVLYSSASGLKSGMKLFCPGDTIGITRGRTLHPVTRLAVTDIVLDEKTKTYLFTVEGDTSAVEEGDTVENLSAQPEILMTDCVFGSFRGTMRLQSRSKTVVRSCVFGNAETALLFTGDTNYWMESGPVQDMLIEACRFDHVGTVPRIRCETFADFTPEDNYYHRGITLQQCSFSGSGTVAQLSHMDDITLSDNTYSGVCNVSAQSCGRVECDIPVIRIE